MQRRYKTAHMGRAPPVNPLSDEAIGERLRITRTALGLTQAAMAQIMGSSTLGSVWANYEGGKKRISLDNALILCAKFGLTLDWIYRGNIYSLPRDLARAIEAHQKKED